MTANALNPASVLDFAMSPREGRRAGATMTVVTDASGGRVTVRFRRPKGFGSVLVDVMTGSDNEADFAFLGTVRPNGFVAVSPKSKAGAKGLRAQMILNWTFAHAQADDLRTVRVLHSGCCGRCGRKLTVPESIDSGLGPECAKKAA